MLKYNNREMTDLVYNGHKIRKLMYGGRIVYGLTGITPTPPPDEPDEPQTGFEDWTSTMHEDSGREEKVWNVVAGKYLTFEWWVSSEGNYDWLTIYLRNPNTGSQMEIVRKSGEDNGTYGDIVPDGYTQLMAVYSKDGSVANGQDAGGVRNIQLLDEALPEPEADYDFGDRVMNRWFDSNYGIENRNLDYIRNITYLPYNTDATFKNAGTFLNLSDFDYLFTGGSNFPMYSITLTKAWLPRNLQRLEQWFFINNMEIHSCVLPSSVNWLGSQALWNCDSNNKGWHWLVFLSEQPPYLSGDYPNTIAVAGLTGEYREKLNAMDFKIYVPTDSLDAYLADQNWQHFADYLHPLSEFENETRALENVPPWWTEQYNRINGV